MMIPDSRDERWAGGGAGARMADGAIEAKLDVR